VPTGIQLALVGAARQGEKLGAPETCLLLELIRAGFEPFVACGTVPTVPSIPNAQFA